MADPSEHRATPLPCCVEAPASYLPKARYALRMLLLPLGLEPRWVERAALAGGGLYYGTQPGGLPENVLALRLHPATAAYFDGATPYDPARARWIDWDGERWPVLFGEPGRGEADLVASAFFWLSGWQEVTTRERDPHGRFPHHTSLQARLGTTLRPAVDACREVLAGRLAALGLPLHRRTWGTAAWACCPTHDVDYLRKWRKGMVYREVVEYPLRNLRRVVPAARARRFGRFVRDWLRPGDVYRQAFERMQHEVEQRGGTATFFLKTAAHGPQDVFYDPGDPYLRRRIAALEAAGFEVGLHPSYHAHTHPFYLEEERARLAAVTARAPVSVRQHFLRYEAPATPRLQHAAGFRIDSTLGFAEHEGFRHATCLPFQLFDSIANRPLDVWEMPLALMESALFNRRALTPEAARQATETVLATCRRFGGAAVMLWHNVLWDELDHPGWGAHFVETLEAAVAAGAHLASLRAALSAWLGEEV